MNLLRSKAFLLIIPIIASILSLILRAHAGHFWQHCDPSYMFLFNALHMIKHITPTYFDNPGTPLQILILWIIHSLCIGCSSIEILNRVLLNPEFYLYVTFYVLLITSFVTYILIANYVYNKTQDKIAAILTQLPWLSFFALKAFETGLPVLPVISNIGGEHMLIIWANLFNLCFLSLFFSKSSRQGIWAVAGLSLFCGLGLATKFTFASLFCAALLIVPWRLKIFFIIGSVLSFMLGTFPVISKYPMMFHYISTYSNHTGLYGTGGEGFIQWPIYWKNFQLLSHFFLFYVLASFGLFIWGMIQLIKNRRDRNSQFFAAAVSGNLIHLLLVTKHLSFHYLLAGFSLFSSILCLFYLQTIAKNKILKVLTIITITLYSVTSIYQNLIYAKGMSELSDSINSLYQRVSSQYPNALILPASTVAGNIYITPKHGLFLGNYASLHNENDELDHLYPHSYYFDTESTDPGDREDGYGIRDFYGNRVFAEDLMATGAPIIFIKLGTDFSGYGLTVRQIDSSKYDSAYLLLGSTEKQAYELFMASQELLEQGKYKEAFAFALKAKELGFQPLGKINYYLSIVYQHL